MLTPSLQEILCIQLHQQRASPRPLPYPPQGHVSYAEHLIYYMAGAVKVGRENHSAIQCCSGLWQCFDTCTQKRTQKRCIELHPEHPITIRYSPGSQTLSVGGVVFTTNDPSHLDLTTPPPPPLPPPPSPPPTFNEGDRIFATHPNYPKYSFYEGVIKVVHGDATYDIDYKDGDEAFDVPAHQIKRRG